MSRRVAQLIALMASTFVVGCGGDGGPPDGTPDITSVQVSSDHLAGGLIVTITGTGLTGADEVLFGTVEATDFAVLDDTTISVRVPAGTAVGAVDVTVTSGGGSDALAGGFTYFSSYIYAAQGTGGRPGPTGSYLWRVNPLDGTLTKVGQLLLGAENVTVTGMTFDDQGNLWATESTEGGTRGDLSGDSRFFQIDPDTAVVTSVGALLDVGGVISHNAMPDIAFSNGTLFGWTEDTDQPVTIDTATGVVTVLGGGISSAGSGMAADAAGILYVAPEGDAGAVYSIDPVTGVVTLVIVLTGGAYSEISGMTFWNGTLYAVEGDEYGGPETPARLVTIDLTTGAITQVGDGLPLGTECVASLDS